MNNNNNNNNENNNNNNNNNSNNNNNNNNNKSDVVSCDVYPAFYLTVEHTEIVAQASSSPHGSVRLTNMSLTISPLPYTWKIISSPARPCEQNAELELLCVR